MESLLTLHHSDKDSNSELNVCERKSSSLREKNMLVSSAKRMKSKTFDTLHTYIINVNEEKQRT